MAKCLKIQSSKNNDTGDIIMEIIDEPQFDSEEYRTVELNEFRRCYTEILTSDGRWLKDCGVLRIGGKNSFVTVLI